MHVIWRQFDSVFLATRCPQLCPQLVTCPLQPACRFIHSADFILRALFLPPTNAFVQDNTKVGCTRRLLELVVGCIDQRQSQSDATVQVDSVKERWGGECSEGRRRSVALDAETPPDVSVAMPSVDAETPPHVSVATPSLGAETPPEISVATPSVDAKTPPHVSVATPSVDAATRSCDMWVPETTDTEDLASHAASDTESYDVDSDWSSLSEDEPITIDYESQSDTDVSNGWLSLSEEYSVHTATSHF